MKLATIALTSAFALSATVAFANTAHHNSSRRPIVMLLAWFSCIRTTGNPNGNPDGPNHVSGTGDSSFGGFVARYQRLTLRVTWYSAGLACPATFCRKTVAGL